MRPFIGFRPVPGEYVSKGDNKRKWQWDGQPKRCPKKGERYLSGAIVCAYMARQDMTTEYFIAAPAED